MSTINADNMKAEKSNVPQSGFTQRATIDCERDEIYVLSVSIFFSRLICWCQFTEK